MTRLTLRAGIVCLLAGAIPAATFSPHTTKELVDLAERVCCARCESVEARLDPRSGMVFTHVRLRLMEDIKGRGQGSLISLRLIGGRAGGVATVVAGMPRFTQGGESVLLLGKPNRLGHPVVVAARRGVLGLLRDKSGRRHLGRVVTGMPGLPARRLVSLEAFRASVRQLVRERERGRHEEERK